MTITSSGRVGIGNTVPVSALVVSTTSDTSSLGQSGILIQGADILTTGNVMALSFSAIPGTIRARAAVGSVVGADWGKGNLTFYTRDASDSSALSTADEKMRITSGGNVGIGTTTVNTARLEVTGPIPTLFTANSQASSLTYGGSIFYRNHKGAGQGNGISFALNNSSDTLVEYAYIGGVIETDTVGNVQNGAIIFCPTSSGGRSERVRITSGGNVLIGTQSDNGARLQVNGSSTTLLATLVGEGNTTTSLYGINIVTSSSTPVTIDISTGRSNALFQISIDAMSYDVGVTHWVTAVGRGYLFPSGFGISTSIISNSGLSASLSYVSNAVVRVTITDSVSSSSKSGVCRITVTAKSP
jgi:hypothetical protein